MHHAHIVALALLYQEAIEVLKAGHARQRHEKIAPTEADTPLYASLLMPLRWRAVVGREQVVAAKGHKGPLLFADASLNQGLDRRREIVVTEPVGHAAEKLEGAHMPQQEGFLLLGRKGHHKGAA